MFEFHHVACPAHHRPRAQIRDLSATIINVEPFEVPKVQELPASLVDADVSFPRPDDGGAASRLDGSEDQPVEVMGEQNYDPKSAHFDTFVEGGGHR